MKNTAKKKIHNQKKQDMLSMLKNILGYIASTYLIVMTVIFPLYTRRQYIHTSSHKLASYRFLSFLFLGVTLIVCLVYIFALIRRKQLKQNLSEISHRITLPDIGVIAYGICNFISFFVSPYHEYAFLGFEGWQMGLLTQLLMIAGYFLVRLFYKNEPFAWYATASALVLQSILVVLNRTGNDPLGFYKGLDWFDWKRRNLLGTIGNINWLCGYLICALPVLMVLYVYAKKTVSRIIIGTGLYFSFAALFLQGSESGTGTLLILLLILPFFLSDTVKHLLRYLEMLFMICAFWSLMTIFNVDLIEPEGINTPQTVYSYLWLIPTVLLLAVILFLNLRIQKSGKAKTSLVGQDPALPKSVGIVLKIIPCLILSAALAIFILCQFSDPVWQFFGAKSILRLSPEWGSMRGAVWSETLSHFTVSTPLHFLFGFGPDTYTYWFLNSGIAIHNTGAFENAVYTNAHNEFITILVNNGINGLISYTALFILFIRHFIKNYKVNPIYMIGLLCTLAYIINQFVSFQQIFVTPLFFLILGMCMNRKE